MAPHNRRLDPESLVMTPEHQRTILTGLAAFQLQLVGPADLADALADWAADKSRGLGEVLVARGALSEASLALLRPVVEQHVREHGGDPAASVAALAASGSTLDFVLDGVADDDVRATRSLLSAALPRPGGGERPPEGAGDKPRFSIVRHHAAGGLGDVFVARDRDLNRHVALKSIRGPAADDEAVRTRFGFEAEVTGGLEHPGIVPVYALGSQEDGRPFYVMRLVRGDSLGVAVRAFHEARPRPRRRDFQGVAFRGLLGRVIDVCNAVEYAHSRGVLHRDLKPGNIMLGRHGETLVVDWGLAKAVDPKGDDGVDAETLLPISGNDSYRTLMGQTVGTPFYMSPEAARGEVAAMTPASDVYCLGATLYHVACGQAPFEGLVPGDPASIKEAVRSGRFRPPREAMPALPAPLASVIAKAMALDPADRYASAEAMAADLERWLADEPVAAHRESWAATGMRAARRNQRPIAAAAAVAAAALVGLSVLSARLADSNADLADSNAALEAALADAEANAASARDAAGGLIDVVAKQLTALPGSEDFRESAVESAYDVFRDVDERSPGDADARSQRALAARVLGAIKRFRKKYAEARGPTEEAVAIRRELAGGAGGEATLVEALLELSVLEKLVDRPAAAAAVLREAGEVLRGQLAGRPEDRALEDQAAKVAVERGGLGEISEDYAAMLADAEEASAVYERRAASDEAEDLDRTYALMTASMRSRSLWELGRRAESAAVFAEAAEKGRRWAERAPAVHTRHFLARLMLYRCRQLGRLRPIPDEADALTAETVRRYEDLQRHGALYENYLARARMWRAAVLRESGDADEAGELLGLAEEHFRGRVASVERPSEFRVDLAHALLLRADAAEAAGDAAAAARLLDEAIAQQRTAVGESPVVLLYARDLKDYEARRASLGEAGGP